MKQDNCLLQSTRLCYAHTQLLFYRTSLYPKTKILAFSAKQHLRWQFAMKTSTSDSNMQQQKHAEHLTILLPTTELCFSHCHFPRQRLNSRISVEFQKDLMML
jgi:hypothetical protein